MSTTDYESHTLTGMEAPVLFPLEPFRRAAVLGATILAVVACGCGSGKGLTEPKQVKGVQATATAATLTATPTPTSFTLTGSISGSVGYGVDVSMSVTMNGVPASGPAYNVLAQTCKDTIVGAPVKIRNEKDEVIAFTTTTADPSVEQIAQRAAILNAQWQVDGGDMVLAKQIDDFDKTATCVGHFSTTVPATKWYQIRIGSRNAPAYSFDELKANDFSVDLVLR